MHFWTGLVRGSSIYDVHTEGVRLRWTHADGGGVSSMWTSTQKIRARALTLSCLLMQRSWFFKTRFSSLDRI